MMMLMMMDEDDDEDEDFDEDDDEDEDSYYIGKSQGHSIRRGLSDARALLQDTQKSGIKHHDTYWVLHVSLFFMGRRQGFMMLMMMIMMMDDDDG